MPTVLEMLLASGKAPDLLPLLLSMLREDHLCIVSRVCWGWAKCAEVALKERCHEHGWQLPRSRRLQQGGGRLASELPWRKLFLDRSCHGCMRAVGDFAVRSGRHGAAMFHLCGPCAKQQRVHERLVASDACLDVTGRSGKPLYTKKGSSFCAEVSAASKASLDAMHG